MILKIKTKKQRKFTPKSFSKFYILREIETNFSPNPSFISLHHDVINFIYCKLWQFDLAKSYFLKPKAYNI